MKNTATLLAALLGSVVSGIVIPDDTVALQLSLQSSDTQVGGSGDVNVNDIWRYAVASFSDIGPEQLDSIFDDTDPSTDGFIPGHPGDDFWGPGGHPHPPHHKPPPHRRPHRPPPRDHDTNKTALDILGASNHTKIFSHLITTYSPSLTSLLNSTDNNYTIFAPLDCGFKRLHRRFKKHFPDKDPPKPSNETIQKFLEYHVVEGKKPYHALLFKDTLPTLLDGGNDLGGNQRLRLMHGGIFGINLNFMSRIIAPNHPTSNGIIHFVNQPIFLPPKALKIVSLLPSQFSTLSLALSKTGMDGELESLSKNGSTFFAPANRAFNALGPRINAFLFNTDKGLEILKALLKYHFSANYTLYTDAIYTPENSNSSLSPFTVSDDSVQDMWASEIAEELEAGPTTFTWGSTVHTDLPTLLKNKPLPVDIRHSILGYKMRVNKWVPVVLPNLVAKDGVIHVPKKVLIPPHPHNKPDDGDNGDELSVDDLIERFQPFISDEETNLEL